MVKNNNEILEKYHKEIDLLSEIPDKSSEVCSLCGRIMQIIAEYGYGDCDHLLGNGIK